MKRIFLIATSILTMLCTLPMSSMMQRLTPACATPLSNALPTVQVQPRNKAARPHSRGYIVKATTYVHKGKLIHALGDRHRPDPNNKKHTDIIFAFTDAALNSGRRVHVITEDKTQLVSLPELIALRHHRGNPMLITDEAKRRGLLATNAECRPLASSRSIGELTTHYDSVVEEVSAYNDGDILNQEYKKIVEHTERYKKDFLALLPPEHDRTIASFQPLNTSDNYTAIGTTGILSTGLALASLAANSPEIAAHMASTGSPLVPLIVGACYLKLPQLKNIISKLLHRADAPIDIEAFEAALSAWPCRLPEGRGLHAWHTNQDIDNTLFIMGAGHTENIDKVFKLLGAPVIHQTVNYPMIQTDTGMETVESYDLLTPAQLRDHFLSVMRKVNQKQQQLT